MASLFRRGVASVVVVIPFLACGCASSSHSRVRTYDSSNEARSQRSAPRETEREGESGEYEMVAPGEMVGPGEMAGPGKPVVDPD